MAQNVAEPGGAFTKRIYDHSKNTPVPHNLTPDGHRHNNMRFPVGVL